MIKYLIKFLWIVLIIPIILKRIRYRKMRNNILNAILNFTNDSEQKLKAATNQDNRLHALGESLEKYVKDIFAGTLECNEEERNKIQNEFFSYGGGKNTPPDAIIQNGDAIEIKKLKKVEDILSIAVILKQNYIEMTNVYRRIAEIVNKIHGQKKILYMQ